jgi:hypothetical protein
MDASTTALQAKAITCISHTMVRLRRCGGVVLFEDLEQCK